MAPLDLKTLQPIRVAKIAVQPVVSGGFYYMLGCVIQQLLLRGGVQFQ